MKAILSTILFCTSTFLFAQEDNTSHANGIILGISYSPDYCYRDLQSRGAGMEEFTISHRNSFERPKLGFTAGISAQFPISEKLRFETGLYYANKGEQLVLDLSDITFGEMVDTRYGFVYQSVEMIPTFITIDHQYRYVEIPFILNYEILNKKIRLSFSSGVSVNYFLGFAIKSTGTYDDGTSYTNKSFSSGTGGNIHPTSLAMIGSISIEYPFNDKIGLKAEPRYQRFLTSASRTNLKSYLYSAGIQLGIIYDFGS